LFKTLENIDFSIEIQGKKSGANITFTPTDKESLKSGKHSLEATATTHANTEL